MSAVIYELRGAGWWRKGFDLAGGGLGPHGLVMVGDLVIVSAWTGVIRGYPELVVVVLVCIGGGRGRVKFGPIVWFRAQATDGWLVFQGPRARFLTALLPLFD